MGKVANLSREKRASIVALHAANLSQRQIAIRVNCSLGSVHNTIRRFEETGSNQDRRRSGRPRASTPRQDAYLRRLAKRRRLTTATTLLSEWQPTLARRVSIQTVRNR